MSSFSHLSASLKKMQQANAAPITAPRRSHYSMSTSMRINAINNALDKGRTLNVHARIPVMDTGLAIKNCLVNLRTVLGLFESPEQAVLFAITGLVRTGAITLEDILTVGPSRSGFFRRLNETQIAHLLSAKRLLFDLDRTAHEISIFTVSDDGFEVEIEGPGPEPTTQNSALKTLTGRKFR